MAPEGIMSATPEPTFKTIGRPEHASTDPGKPALAENASADLRKSVREASRTPKNGPRNAPGRPKIVLGVPWELPGAPSGPPSDSPRSSPEPPKRELANRYRGTTISAPPVGTICTPGATQPPPFKIHHMTLLLSPLPLTGPARPPPPPDPRVGGFDWAAPTAADPKKESSGQQCRERPAQILLTSLQTNGGARRNHVRDT